ncbi:MAG: type IIA DNA topoisomerase subunit B [Deltaproteobacteria bacterium]|nr:MAG: type IIA DNA topoisomerase subunit B [Deltaproteobacteria bacterium]
MSKPKGYGAQQIAVLKGLDPVRKRPGMYIGGTGSEGLHHLLWEIVDNSIDEAMNGHASRIGITLHADGTTLTIEDNGRGIPTDEHPTEKVSALQVIFTTLHAGGKFDGDNYKTSGGLHGVGSSVVNALSMRLHAEVRRDGQRFVQEYRRGIPQAPVQAVGPARGTGTAITFTPDPEIFPDTAYDPETIHRTLEQRSFLHRGVKITFKDEVNGQTHELEHSRGLLDYLDAVQERRSLTPVIDAPFVHERELDEHKVDLVLNWTEAPRDHWLSFVNGIPTGSGGSHEQGLRDALVKAVRSFMDAHSLAPKNLTISAEDLREGVVAILSYYTPEPQFQGQTKDKLNNPEARSTVDSSVRPILEQWLHDNKSRGEMIVMRASQAARARLASRQAASAVRRKTATSGRINLPGKLSDCTSSDPNETEIFLVEGDSAGGTARQGRDRRTQAVLPLRGKVLNAEQASLKKVLANEELSNIVTALGCGIGEQLKQDKLRYGRIILLMDADTDGHHITTLMLAFFFNYLKPLLQEGYVYIAQPPLYRINVGQQTHWAQDDPHKERILAALPARAKPEITRFKGLGEMPAKTLFETTLDPKARRLLRVTIADPMQANLTMGQLMGKDPAPRYRFLMEEAESLTDVESLDL